VIGIVLAAGRGSRLDPSESAIPKCLTQIGKLPLLERTLCALDGAGVSETYIVVGYRQDLVRAQFPGLNYIVNDRWEESNMVESLLLAHEVVGDERAIVIYGDVYVDALAIAEFETRTRDEVLAVASLGNWREHWYRRYEDPLTDLESFRVDQRGYLREIGHPVTDPAAVAGQYIGIISIGPKGWRTLAAAAATLAASDKARISMTELLDRIVNATDCQIFVSEYSGNWAEIDTPADLRYYVATLEGT
jgi:choline kinase